jgi:tRNA modification GTPase
MNRSDPKVGLSRRLPHHPPLNDDTICAVATPLGEGGIGLIRVSGGNAIQVVSQIFEAKGRQLLSKVKTHTIHYGRIVDPATGQGIDEVLVSVMRAPRTYTCEDVVEIGCHGGSLLLRRVLETLVIRGARLAAPGEFTKRAFLNGRLDLAQAEGVLDLIRAKTEAAQRAALAQLQGGLSSKVHQIREPMISLLAHIEAAMDFAEEEIESISAKTILHNVETACIGIRSLIQSADEGRILREGIAAAIIGRPNVGKSSLLNALLREDRAIVTPLPGTTRDVLEETVNVKGVPVRIQDTAGLRSPQDPPEEEGIRRTLRAVDSAALVLAVFDLSEPVQPEDLEVLAVLRESQKLIVLNKADQPCRLEIADLTRQLPATQCIQVSAITGFGMDSLCQAIYEVVLQGKAVQHHPALVNLRHKEALIRAEKALGDLTQAVGQKTPHEFLAADLRCAVDALGEIIGEVTTEDLLDRIFRDFCIGK